MKAHRGALLAAAGIAVGVGVAVLVSTCAAPDTSRAVASDATLADQCGSAPNDALRLTATASDGVALGGAVVNGTSASADSPVVIVRHGGSHTLCDWLDWSAEVAEQTDATLLLLDRRGQGSSPGPADLAESGRPFVVLGSSMGNASAFSLLEHLPQAACAAIGVSPVPAAGSLDGIAALGELSAFPDLAPATVHLTWAKDDGEVSQNAAALAAAARDVGTQVTQLEVDGDAHARAVLDRHDEAQDSFIEAITACS